MSFILGILEAQTLLESIWRGFLFLICSFLLVWLMASILSRTKIIIQDDAELKVHFGSLISLNIYTIIIVILLLFIGIHYKGLDISLWHILPYLVALFISFFLALNLSNKIHSKLLEIRNKRRK